MAIKGAGVNSNLPTNVDMGASKANWHLWGKERGYLEVYISKIRGDSSKM